MHSIEVDTGVCLDKEGVFYYTYVGNGGDPIIEQTATWDTLLKQLIDENCIPNTDAVVVDGEDDAFEALFAMADVLREAADELEKRVLDGRVFLRSRWEEAGFNDAEDFYITGQEYLDYLMEKEDEA